MHLVLRNVLDDGFDQFLNLLDHFLSVYAGLKNVGLQLNIGPIWRKINVDKNN